MDYGLKQDKRGIWKCDFSVAGKRFQKSTFTDNREAAEEWCAQLASGAWKEKKLGSKPSIRWDEAVRKWAKEKEREDKRDLANDLIKARRLAEHLDGKELHKAEASVYAQALDELQDEFNWSSATRNRSRAFILSVLKHAREAGYEVPALKLKRYKESTPIVRWISKEEAARLLKELPLYLRRMVHFSLLTGLRQANVLNLPWVCVLWHNNTMIVPPERSKSKKELKIYLQPEAIELLKEARDCPEHGSKTWAFTYYGTTISQPSCGPHSSWNVGLKRAGIEDFRWHDLRHTWASWHAMGLMNSDENGRPLPTPLNVLQQLGGWSSLTMVQRYAHLGQDYLQAFAGSERIAPAKPEPVPSVPAQLVVAHDESKVTD